MVVNGGGLDCWEGTDGVCMGKFERRMEGYWKFVAVVVRWRQRRLREHLEAA